MLDGYPTLSRLTDRLNNYLIERHGDFFGPKALHPFSTVKPYKVIHDSLWGTNRFNWRELAIMDSPILQRLRGIHKLD
jgi:hypothetical protein